jgi:hypothetical protein
MCKKKFNSFLQLQLDELPRDRENKLKVTPIPVPAKTQTPAPVVNDTASAVDQPLPHPVPRRSGPRIDSGSESESDCKNRPAELNQIRQSFNQNSKFLCLLFLNSFVY